MKTLKYILGAFLTLFILVNVDAQTTPSCTTECDYTFYVATATPPAPGESYFVVITWVDQNNTVQQGPNPGIQLILINENGPVSPPVVMPDVLCDRVVSIRMHVPEGNKISHHDITVEGVVIHDCNNGQQLSDWTIGNAGPGYAGYLIHHGGEQNVVTSN